MADACVLGFSHILLFHNKSFACRPGIGNRDGENGWAKGERERGKKKGKNDWRDKEGRRRRSRGGLRSYESERRRYSADFRLYPRLFYGDPWEGGKVGVVDFLARKASGSRTIVKLLSGSPRCFIGNRAIYGAEDARQPPPPPPF